ncbi:MAG: NAD-dependent epimerase/dehydratase family protein [Actinomycetota bacterium]|nr:NAD-dependent epimerase/dehydratase family protein [Actinomycetota bacterium]
MKVVVTGGAGFIGANLVRALLSDDAADHVTVVDDLSTGSRENLDGHGVELRVGSILDERLLDDAFRGADAVVHLAARPSVPRSLEDPVASHTANATGTLQVLEAARRAGGLYTVVASSSSVYGADPTLPKSEDSAPRPLSPYAASKLATEAYAQAYASAFGMPVLAFRLFNVFGPLQAAHHAYAAVVPAFVSAALEGRPLTVHGDGRQTRDFTYVDSVTAVILEAVHGRVTSDGPVNLAFGSRRTLLEVVAVLEQALARRLEVVHTPPRPGDVRHSQADQSRLRALFPDLVPVEFEQGLRETVTWFRAARQLQAYDEPA